MRLTESYLRKIVKEELKKTIKRKTTAKMMKEALSRPLPPDADTLLISEEADYGGEDPIIGGPTVGYGLYYYVGTKDAVEAYASGETFEVGPNAVKSNVMPIRPIGSARQWDKYDNGEAPHPVVFWLKKNPQIKFIYDSEFAYDSIPVAEWIAEHSDIYNDGL